VLRQISGKNGVERQLQMINDSTIQQCKKGKDQDF